MLKVYAIDCSDIAKQAKIIIEQNGFSDIVEVFFASQTFVCQVENFYKYCVWHYRLSKVN